MFLAPPNPDTETATRARAASACASTAKATIGSAVRFSGQTAVQYECGSADDPVTRYAELARG